MSGLAVYVDTRVRSSKRALCLAVTQPIPDAQLGHQELLAILAILWPRLPRLKEWAYAGIFFNMAGATVSHVAHDDGAWIIVVTVAIAAITMASWALRPQNRRL
jgi:hypothetical protein